MYEKSRCIKSIYELAKRKGMGIGTLEESCGVSKGYLSRVSKPDYQGSPSIEVLDAMATKLGVGIDYLVNFDPELMDRDDEFLLRLMDTLQRLTDSMQLEWVRETEDILTNARKGEISNPFLVYIEPSSENETGYYRYRSQFLIGRTLVNGDCYHAKLHDENEYRRSSVIYLNSVIYISGEIRTPAIEVYFVDDSGIDRICTTIGLRSALKSAVTKLYSSAEILRDTNRIFGHGRSVLEKFIEKNR